MNLGQTKTASFSQEVLIYLGDRQDGPAQALRGMVTVFDDAMVLRNGDVEATRAMLRAWERLRQAYWTEQERVPA